MKQSAWVALLASALCLAGCGTLVRDGLVRSYMGIPFDASETSPEIADLARRSLAGDKQAQLDLGIAFEEGCAIERDLDKARKLYKLAASDSGGPIRVYVPGVNGSTGRVMQVGDAPFRVGLEAAKVRLKTLDYDIQESTSLPGDVCPVIYDYPFQAGCEQEVSAAYETRKPDWPAS